MSSRALFIPGGSATAPRWLDNERLSLDATYDEKWLQQLIFEQPQLIPMDEIDPGSEIVPLRRELALPKGDGGHVFLDILGVARSGRLALIECKLWRNPQARREVIGQILEYAALLQRWSYGDLTARLKAQLEWKGENPLFEHVRAAVGDLNESEFVDGVSHSLARGDFNLIVAGDGIRSDALAIGSYLERQSGLVSRVALVEFQVWADANGDRVVLPAVPFRSSVFQQRVVVGADGVPLRVEATEDDEREIERVAGPEQADRRAANRAFWDRFIENLALDHPDQARPRHGGNNWVKLDLPDPANHLTAFRASGGVVGVFARLTGESGGSAYEALRQDEDALHEEIGLDLEFTRRDPEAYSVGARASLDLTGDAGEHAQLQWLFTATNGFINAFRPRLSALTRLAATR